MRLEKNKINQSIIPGKIPELNISFHVTEEQQTN